MAPSRFCAPSMSPSERLAGWRIWVPRAAHQSGPLCALLRSEGADPLCLPALEIQSLAADWPSPGEFDWLLFVSVNAVEQGFVQCPDLVEAAGRFAAIGRATGAALDRHGVSRATLPNGGFDSESLLALEDLREIAGRRVLIVKGEGGRGRLTETLRRRGAEVVELAVYRRSLPDYQPSELRKAFAREPDALIATSGEVLDNMCRLLDEPSRCRDAPLVTVSQRVAERAARLGFRRVFVSREPSDQALLEALVAQRASGR